MRLPLLYFSLGFAFTLTLSGVLLAWDSYHDFEETKHYEILIQERFWPAQSQNINTDQLVGTWQGKESWGTTFEITRNKDGTFTEVRDLTHYNARFSSEKPAIIKSKGRWSVSGGTYAWYYTESSSPSLVKQPPKIIRIATLTPAEMHYFWMEGDGVVETRR